MFFNSNDILTVAWCGLNETYILCLFYEKNKACELTGCIEVEVGVDSEKS